MNRGNIRDLARKRLGETTAVFWEESELNSWIDYAGHDVAYKTKCIQDVGYVTTIEDTSEYTLTTYFPLLIAVTGVYMNKSGNSWLRLDKKTRDELDWTDEGWLDFESSVPQDYIFEFDRNKIIVLSPPPDAANAGTNYLRIYYAKDYSDISNDGQVPAGINQQLQLAMVDFVVAYGYETRGYTSASSAMWQMYHNKLATYLAIRDKEEEEDEQIVMKPYRNR